MRYTGSMEILAAGAAWIAAALYIAAAWHTHRAAAPGAREAVGRRPLSPWLLAAVFAHAVALRGAVDADDGLRYGFAQALSATFLLGAALLWFEGLNTRSQALQSVIAPLAGAMVLLPLAFPGEVIGAEAGRPLFVPHLIAGTLAYGVLMLATLHAALMTAAERALHEGSGGARSIFGRWVAELPPLLTMERILFRMIGVGFLLLTLAVVSGVFFTEDVFGKPLRLDHKTVLTLLSWAMFGLLLFGRWRWGWRGRTALRLTLSAYVVLLLGYVGSRFVVEVLLAR